MFSMDVCNIRSVQYLHDNILFFFLMMVPVLTFLHLVKIVNCLDSFFSQHVTRKKMCYGGCWGDLMGVWTDCPQPWQ